MATIEGVGRWEKSFAITYLHTQITYNIKESAISQGIVCLIYNKNKCNKSKMLHLCKLKGFHLDIYEILKITGAVM